MTVRKQVEHVDRDVKTFQT